MNDPKVSNQANGVATSWKGGCQIAATGVTHVRPYDRGHPSTIPQKTPVGITLPLQLILTRNVFHTLQTKTLLKFVGAKGVGTHTQRNGTKQEEQVRQCPSPYTAIFATSSFAYLVKDETILGETILGSV